MSIKPINLWKYWRNKGSYDITVVDIDLSPPDKSFRFVVLNIGFYLGW